MGGILISIVLTSIEPLCLGAYSSPLSIYVAGIAFCFFKRVSCSPWVGELCCFLGPSIFSVYLLHTHKLGFMVINNAKESLARFSIPYPLICLMVAIMIFIVCLGIDLMRRAIINVILCILKADKKCLFYITHVK